MQNMPRERLASRASADDLHFERETGLFAYVSKSDLFFAIKIVSIIELALMAMMQF